MLQWQLLRGSRANQAALGYRVQHGAAASVHYSSVAAAAAAAAAAAPVCSRSFCLSREKQTMQQLNGRLASYLQQVQLLEAANQRLELQIQEELNRKCPGELRQLDRHLRRVSLLQNEIGDCFSAQTQVKLQLLGAQLDAFDLNVRCEKERERCDKAEAELSGLRELQAELKVHKLPELQSLLDNRMQHLVELQTQHQQNVQVLVAQVSGGIAVEMQTAESSDLLRQLEHLRTSVTPLDRNPNESWLNTQVSTLSSPEVTFDPAMGSDLDQAEVKELRRTAATLTEELIRLQTLISVLEVSGQEQYESFVLQLEALQQRVDGLCRDLDSVRQAAAQQAADYDALLDIKSRLEAEIQDYKRLLDEMNHQRVSNLNLNSQPVTTSPCVTTSPSTFRRNVTVDETIRVLQGNLRTPEVQTVSKGCIRTVELAPQSEKVTTVQVMRDESEHLKNSAVRSVNTANVTHSSQSVGTLPESTGTESLTVKATVDKESNLVGYKVHAKDCDLQNTLIVKAQISQGIDKDVSVKASQTEIIATMVHDSNAAVQTKVETSSGITKTETKNEIEMIQTSRRVEPEVKPEPHFKTSDPGKSTATEETETVTLAQMAHNGESVHAKNKTPEQIMTYELETTSEVTQTSSEESGSHTHRPASVQDKVFDEVTLMEDKSIVIEGEKEEEVVEAEGVPGLGQSLILSKKFEIETEEVEVINDTTEVKVEPIELGNELVGLAGKEASMSTNLTEVALSSSSPEEALSPKEADVLTNPSPEICLSPVENSQIEMIKTSPHAEPEIKPEPHFEISDPGKPTATEETETVILAQMDPNGDSVHAKMSQTSIEESGSHTHRPAKVEVEVFHEVTLIDDKDVEIQGQNQAEVVEAEGVPRQGQNSALSKKIEIEMEVISNAVEVKVDSTQLSNEFVGLAGKEASMSTSLTDSGVAFSSSRPEEVLNPKEVDVLTSPRPEMCLSPVETDAIMSITDDQLFFPVDLDDHVGIPDLLLNPNDPEMFPGPDDCDTCLCPVEINTCLSPNDEEDGEDACLGLTEANVHVRPVEKYTLSTKEEDQSLTFDGAQEGDRNTKVIMSDREGLVIRPFEGNKEKEVISSGTSIGSSTQMSRSPSGAEFVDLGVQSIIADKEEQLGFGGLYPKSVRDIENGVASEDKKESMESDEMVQRKYDRQVANKPGNSESVGSPNEDATLRSVASKSKATIVSSNENAQAVTAGGRLVHGSGEWIVYGGSLGRTSTSNTGGEENQSVTMVPETSQPDTGRFGSRGSGEWMVYGGSLRRKSSLDSRSSEQNEGIISGDSKLATSAPETGRLGKRGNGEWIVYAGSLERKTSLDGVSTLSSKGNEGNPSVDSKLAMSPPETGRFGSRGSGEWMAYGGHKSRLAGSHSLPNIETKEYQSTAMNLSKSTSETGRLSSTGSGEWRVYGGRISSRAGSDGLLSAEREGSPSVATQRAFSSPGGGRFGSEGSGEWRVYGGSTGRVSTATGNNDVISPPSSCTRSGSRRSSAGSGSKLSSSCVVRRSSSVGSGGRLSSSGSGGMLSSSTTSHRISGSGRYTSTGSGEWKPVYSSVSGRKSSAGSTGWPTTSQRAPSPGRRMGSGGGSGGWLNSSAAGGNRISGTGSGSKLSSQSPGSNERISSIGGGRISSSSGSGRTNSTGGRVISSSDRPIRSTGSGTGSHKERISVCKMAALTISAAGRKKSKEKQKEEQRSQEQPQQAAASSPLLQRWLTSADLS
ncbi:uncharacterized protein LOC111584888 [Amphiprion ocellaris]|uniref:uncharacterized protein LOC111584888 n=1 Tax=Amphiprion ocellaris TaxID=80972 RepID=UPI0024117BDD|nr:uncharacterized protein LOC111584888 [Amphiprion ocellaris]